MSNFRQRWHADRAPGGLRPALRHGILGFFFALTLATASGGGAIAQGAVKSVHKDWQIRCDTPPGAKSEQCALIQSVTAEDRANVGLTVIVLKTADQKSKLMRVVAPLGVATIGVLAAAIGTRHTLVAAAVVAFAANAFPLALPEVRRLGWREPPMQAEAELSAG